MSDANASVETLQAELQLARLKVYRLDGARRERMPSQSGASPPRRG